MMMFNSNLFLAVAALAFGIASGRLDAPFASQDMRRRDQVCPTSDQHNLFFNVDIAIQDSGGLCKPADMSRVAELIQDMFDDLENSVPEYENESMSTVVCPKPLLGKTYVYKVGGKFTRCGDYEGQRFLQVNADAVCEWADLATSAASAAAKTSRKAGVLFRQHKNLAKTCENRSVGRKAIATDKASMKAIRKAVRAAKLGANSALQFCEQAKAAMSETELSEYLQEAKEASTQSQDHADMVEGSFSQMQGIDVCNSDGPVKTTGGVNIDNLSDPQLRKVAYKLYEKTGERVPALISAGEFGPGCLDVWSFSVNIFAVQSLSYLSPDKRASWISSARDC